MLWLKRLASIPVFIVCLICFLWSLLFYFLVPELGEPIAAFWAEGIGWAVCTWDTNGSYRG